MNNISGLHSCKPGNEPVVGQVKTFVVEQKTGKSGKAYTKITNKKAEDGGQPHKILSVNPTGFTDRNGNVSYNIEVEPANGATPTQQQQHQAGKMYAGSDDRSSRIERQHSQEMSLRYFALSGIKPDTTQLREMTSWFQRDIGNVPATKHITPVSEAGDSVSPPEQYGDEEPF